MLLLCILFGVIAFPAQNPRGSLCPMHKEVIGQLNRSFVIESSRSNSLIYSKKYVDDDGAIFRYRSFLSDSLLKLLSVCVYHITMRWNHNAIGIQQENLERRGFRTK
ncbi:uncharacterized protein LOC129306841 [Prosopis cineraria]|uniref:uncharacterized protein LOC129306841 n=1 Tax=Prosopis cineraria TaxID=364024 RepID=UPI00240FBEBE|nr:uncharacterized protein LOC129306841 [Prosopis cineraria]